MPPTHLLLPVCGGLLLQNGRYSSPTYETCCLPFAFAALIHLPIYVMGVEKNMPRLGDNAMPSLLCLPYFYHHFLLIWMRWDRWWCVEPVLLW